MVIDGVSQATGMGAIIRSFCRGLAQLLWAAKAISKVTVWGPASPLCILPSICLPLPSNQGTLGSCHGAFSRPASQGVRALSRKIVFFEKEFRQDVTQRNTFLMVKPQPLVVEKIEPQSVRARGNRRAHFTSASAEGMRSKHV